MPRKDTQFAPGKSGNPKGRPKGAVGGRALAIAALDEMLAEKPTQEKILADFRRHLNHNGAVAFFDKLAQWGLIPKNVGGDSPDPEALPSLEVTKRLIYEEYKQRGEKPVDLGIAGLEPLQRRMSDAGDNGGDGHGDNGPDD